MLLHYKIVSYFDVRFPIMTHTPIHPTEKKAVGVQKIRLVDRLTPENKTNQSLTQDETVTDQWRWSSVLPNGSTTHVR